MDSIYDLIMDFLKRQSGSCVDCQLRRLTGSSHISSKRS